LHRITGETIRVNASGRTDSGVHAEGQVVSFESEMPLTPEAWQRALNAELPLDMAVLQCELAPDGFHARRDAKRKRYRYTLDDGQTRDVFTRLYTWQFRQRLDVPAMHRAAQALVGEHDFASFQSQGSERETSVRTVFGLSVARLAEPTSRITVEIEGSGFLYNMVRAIVGTLVEVGRGVQPEEWVGQVLAAKHRRAAGQTAPAHGLCLVRVEY
jgi:tRNA pseudouridine38-40 synthase